MKQVAETERWGDVLALVLGGGGGPGEGEGVEYTPEGVESFAETREGGLVKVGRKVRLLDLLAGGKVEVVDGVVKVFVVPKGKVEAWVRGMRERKGKN